MMKPYVFAAALVLVAVQLTAQSIRVGEGWEGFADVTYQGGDATQPKKKTGLLMLTDTTIALRQCVYRSCTQIDKKTGQAFRPTVHISIPLASIRRITTSSHVRGPNAGDRLILGFLASDHSEDLIGIVYETANGVESPLFKSSKIQVGSIEAKLRFKLKQIGVDLPDLTETR